MDDQQLADQFQRHRPLLTGVATRLLGSRVEAQDAVQDAWLRASRAGAADIDNVAGWLTTITVRLCLTRLRGRCGERALDEALLDPAPGPERDALLGAAVADALQVVLDTLTPSERVAFVLHDVFCLPFADIADIVDRSPVAVRQLASRARRRVGAAGAQPSDQRSDRVVVEAFLTAARGGDLAGLVGLLDPDVVLRADPAAVRAASGRPGAPALTERVRGEHAVAGVFSGRAAAARLAMVDGLPAAVWAPGGTPRVVFDLTVRAGRVVAVDLLTDPDLLAGLNIDLV